MKGRFAAATGWAVPALWCVTALSALAVTGCSAKTDDRFAAETYDEYTQPLTNAVIGTPAGVITIGATPTAQVVVASGSSSGGAPVGAAASAGSVSGSSGGTGSSSGTVVIPGGGVGVGGSSSGVFEDGGVGSADASPDGGSTGGFGQWHFDDCSATSNFLVDSSGEGANAQHALGADCVPGISGLGVDIRSAKDVVQVPDEPQFTVSSRVAVAAWVHPNTVSGDQPIVIKRLNNQTSFSLGIHNGNVEMAVVLANGTTVISRAPITAGTWSHVAGMYDGTFVFLFIDGQQFGQVFGGGNLRDVFAPIRIGATTQKQFFDGIIDEVFVSTQDVTATQLEELACITRPSTLAVTPATSGPVPFDSTVHFDVNVTDNDVGFCQQKSYDLFFETFDPTITTSTGRNFQSLSAGATADFGVDVTPTENADPGVHQLPFEVESFPSQPPFNVEFLTGQLTLDITQPSGCFVFSRRELMITDTSIVDDPVRTFGSSGGLADAGPVLISPPPLAFSVDAGTVGASPSSGGVAFAADDGGITAPEDASAPDVVSITLPDGGTNPSTGVWSFGHLMREMAPSPDQAPAMTLQLFQHWLSPQVVNGFTVAARPNMQSRLLDIWPKTASGDLDLDQAPLTLQAIVNRIDLRDLSKGSAGEGRFVFGVNGPFNFQQFTVIVEYNMPATTPQDVANWAARWHALSSLPFPSEAYNAALEAITRSFTDHNAQPGAVNGSALAELRTNEIALSDNGVWELRGFVLSPTTGFLDETTVKETPDLSFNGTQTLADFVNQNAAAIEAVVPGAMAGTVPPQFEGQNFLGGSVFNQLIPWNAPGITDTDARFHMSTNTCNGCHGPDTNTAFLMITPRFNGQQATLSPFITGTTVTDPFSGKVRTLNDLGRRQADLTGLVCGSDAGTNPEPVDAGGAVEDASPAPPSDAGAIPIPPPPPSPLAVSTVAAVAPN